MRARQRGSITLEMVLAIPVVFMLIWGGTVLSIAATARASLQMTAMRAARELAATDAASRLDKDRLYQYEEFTETYSLSRPKVKMLVVNHGGIIVAGACYRVRLDMPALGKRPSSIPNPVQPIVKLIVPADLLSDVENLASDTQGAWTDSKAVWDQGVGLWNKLKSFRVNVRSKREFVGQDEQFTDLGQFDAAVRRRCGTRNLLLAEHAAFWSEKTEEPAKNEKPDDKKKQIPSVTLTLDPTAVTIPADANPNKLPKVTATATVVPPDSDCTIQVMYSSGPSDAPGLKSPTIDTNDEHRVYQWTWNVGANTASGDWPVTVKCTNLQPEVVKLKVTGR